MTTRIPRRRFLELTGLGTLAVSSKSFATDGKVCEILAKKAKTQPENLDLETSLDTLGIDSLDTVEIIFSLEDEFNISIPETNDIQQRFKNFAPVADVITMVESLLEPAQTK